MSQQRDQVSFLSSVLGEAWYAHIDNAGTLDLTKFVQINATFESARYMIAHMGDVVGYSETADLLAFANEKAPQGPVCLLDGWGAGTFPGRPACRPGEACAIVAFGRDASALEAALRAMIDRGQAELWLVVGEFYNYPGWQDEGRPVPVLTGLLERLGLERTFIAAAHGDTSVVLRVYLPEPGAAA